MIGYLRGKVISSDVKSVILDVNGVGYKIFTNAFQLDYDKSKNSEIEFWTYLAVRENSLDIYGFSNKEELHLFELLITVSGIGPKSALNIISIAGIHNLKNAISSGDTTHLIKVGGVGKKNAEKIVIELKDKMIELSYSQNNSNDIDVIDALKSLGYSDKDAREVLKKIDKEDGVNDKIKKALKLLS